VSAGDPRSVRSDGSAPWRDPGASLVRSPGWPRGDRPIAHANQTVVEFKDPKTEDSGRVVSLPVSALNALDVHRKRQQEFRQQYGSDYRTDRDLIFANPDGTPLKPDSISASVSALCRRLKLPKGVSLHTPRHSHGSHLLAAGVEITAVSERLRHSSVRVTADVYSHAIRGRDDEAARRWEAFQGRNLPEKQTGVQ
jgi:integrase